MARITVSSDDGRLTHSERVIPEDLDSANFRHCLLERLGWAVADADVPADPVTTAPRHRPHQGASRSHRRRDWESPRRPHAFAA